MSHQPVIGAVLCGGRSRRFGHDKALADVGGTPMGLLVVRALRQAGADPVAAIGGTAGHHLGVPVVPDRYPGQGPLAGLATALTWAKVGVVVVAACDLPLLEADHVLSLLAHATPDQAVVASRDGQVQPSLACWPASFGPEVQRLVESGRRAWTDALSAGRWLAVPVPDEATADADTPAQLSRLATADEDQRSPDPYWEP